MKKKLIEVALPLEAINVASVRENYIYKGNPSAIHKWWAQRPLAACRAVIFASLVDDPTSLPHEFPTEEAQEVERQRLFRIIERLVQWESNNDPEVLAEARTEIYKSTDGNPPPFLDPFCGGGSIPLEAQRLGLEAHGSDLNPIPVLITKALIEIPPKFKGQPPINPDARQRGASSGTWTEATGLAQDVRHYGKLLRDMAEQTLRKAYPMATLPKDYGGGQAAVIAWIWARTVKCPNPACGITMPLVRSFMVSTKAGNPVRVDPIVDEATHQVNFHVVTGAGKAHIGTVGRRGATCVRCSAPASLEYIRSEGRARRIGSRLMASVVEAQGKRLYLSPSQEQEAAALQEEPSWFPDADLPEQSLGFRVQGYGMTRWSDLFSSRQLLTMSTLIDLVNEVRSIVIQDAIVAGHSNAEEYANAVSTYLSFACTKYSIYGCALVPWYAKENRPSMLFSRQAISMVWDYAEVNPFSEIGGSFSKSCAIVCDALAAVVCPIAGHVKQSDATQITSSSPMMISTDPPYYDNVPYATLSDFFYVWLRRSLSQIYPDLFSTLLVPKSQELVADPFRHGGRGQACQFFEEGIGRAFERMREVADPNYPVTVYYAFKQTETDSDEETDQTTVASTGWETMLEGLLAAGFQVTGTWPMRTERTGRMRDTGSNALASSIILVCRSRSEDAPVATRREFITALRRELEDSLLKMMHGNIAPVDLAQATIGPGMAVYSRYGKVVETNGEPLRVRTALQIINQELDTILSATEGDYDSDTRFCIAWFEQFGMNVGPFGEGDVLARAKGTAVSGLAEAGVLTSGVGKVRLLKREEYPADWDPQADTRKPVWEGTQYLVRALETGGEGAAARLCKMLGSGAEPARDLAYRLYSICERKGWASEALAYNSLVIAWPEITRLASNPNILITATGLFAESDL